MEGFFSQRWSKIKSRHKRFNDNRDPIAKEELIELYKSQNGLCAISGLPMHATTKNTELSASLDRIDINKGYEKNNVRLVCARVNLMRSTLDDHDFLWWCRAVVGAHEK